MLLNNGLKFVPTPKLLPRSQLQATIQRFQRSVRLRCQFQDVGPMDRYKVPNPGFSPLPAPPVVEAFLSRVESACLARYDIVARRECARRREVNNLAPGQVEALRMLRQRSDIIIKPADKTLGLTVMCAADYHAALRKHVSDTTTYRDVTDSLQTFVSDTCNRLLKLVERYRAPLGDSLCRYLLQGLEMVQPPSLYLLPKLHKMSSLDAPLVGRPIAACHSWITTCMSIWLADQLNQYLKKYPTIVTDRTALVCELEQTRVSKDAWLFVFDVESLYPHVEHEGCIDACAEAVPFGDGYNKYIVQDFLCFVLKHNVVSVQGRQYQQVFGGAMGTNCMPPAAQLYLALKWEKVAKQQWEKLGAKFPALFKRFIDDGFVVFEGTEQELLAFAELLNSVLENINITFQYSRSQVDFLDLVVYKSGDVSPDGTVGLKVRTHQKELNRYLYIPFHSHHHLGMFKSFINAELIRYVVTNSDECDFNCMVEKFSQRLCQRGYPQHMVASMVSRVSFACRQQYMSSSSSRKATRSNSRSVLAVPYARLVPGLRLPQLLRDEYVLGDEALHTVLPQRPIVAYCKNRNLGSLLVKASH